MRAVGIKLLKNKLSEYVKLAASGETVLVTDRDRVVAQLGPPSPGRSAQPSDAFVAEGIRRGWLRPPEHPLEGAPQPIPAAPFAVLMAELAADRSER